MNPLTRNDLTSNEEHEADRPEWQRKIIALRNERRIHLGEDISGGFENRELVRWQVQEMLRVEKIVDEEAIDHELTTYNPLIPGENELSLTLMIEVDDPERRRELLKAVKGIEQAVFLEIGSDRIPAISHLREDDSPIAPAVHFLLFHLSEAQVAMFDGESEAAIVIDHPGYKARAPLTGRLGATLREEIGRS